MICPISLNFKAITKKKLNGLKKPLGKEINL